MSQPISISKGYAVFDICDTLYFSNTTHDFVRFCIGKDGTWTNRAIYRIFNDSRSPLRYMLLALSRGFSVDLHKKINVYLLGGVPKKVLAQSAEMFVREYLSNREIPEAHRLLRDSQQRGLTVVLCSSSIEPVVEAVASSLNLSWVAASSLDYRDGVFTGRIRSEIAGQKLNELVKRGIAENLALAVSDNLSDEALLLSANEAIAIAYSEGKRRHWERLNVKVIDLSR